VSAKNVGLFLYQGSVGGHSGKEVTIKKGNRQKEKIRVYTGPKVLVSPDGSVVAKTSKGKGGGGGGGGTRRGSTNKRIRRSCGSSKGFSMLGKFPFNSKRKRGRGRKEKAEEGGRKRRKTYKSRCIE